MSREKQIEIEVITYEQERLNYFTDLMNKAKNKFNRLFKKYKDAPYLSEEFQRLSDAGRGAEFYKDVVKMLEKSYRKQSENVIKFPCKVGTTLYFLYNSPYADKPDLTPRIYKTTDWYFEVDKTGIAINTSYIHSFNKKYDYYLGKTVFLTKQEAEQAIAKMKGGGE